MPKNDTNSKFMPNGFIWGHRLNGDQDASMVLMEFLNAIQNLSFSKYDPDNFIFKIPKRLVLRTLLFNNPHIESIGEKATDPWGEWEKLFRENEENTPLFTSASSWNSNYLRKAFSVSDSDSSAGVTERERQSFENFARTLRFIRSSALNIRSEKRWSSCFVFPWGADCLYVDMDQTGVADKKYFSRGGILVYLMLAHAENRDELERLVRSRILDSGNPLNEICKTLQGEDESWSIPNDSVDEMGSFLPAESDLTADDRAHFNSFCDDLIQVLRLSLPAPDMLRHLRDAIGLHLIKWILDRGRWAIGKPENENTIICEMLQKKSTEIRRISKENFIENNKQSEAGLRIRVNKKLNEIRDAQLDDGIVDEDCFRQSVKDQFGFDKNYFSEISSLSEKEFIKRVTDDELVTHRNHMGKALGVYARNIGLATKLYSNAYRYAPSNSLLKSLVMILVDKKRMLLTDFLDKAYTKFGIVIGPAEARKARVQERRGTEEKQFEENQKLLIDRLKSIGLLISLSDGFPYVINRYAATEE